VARLKVRPEEYGGVGEVVLAEFQDPLGRLPVADAGVVEARSGQNGGKGVGLYVVVGGVGLYVLVSYSGTVRGRLGSNMVLRTSTKGTTATAAPKR